MNKGQERSCFRSIELYSETDCLKDGMNDNQDDKLKEWGDCFDTLIKIGYLVPTGEYRDGEMVYKQAPNGERIFEEFMAGREGRN